MTYTRKIIPMLLWAFAQGIFLSACSAEIAEINATDTRPQTLYVQNEPVTTWGTITREEHAKLHRLTGGLNDDGTYRNPALLTDVGLEADTPNGWYLMRFEWDPERGIVLKVQDGFLVQEIFYIPQI